MKYRKKPVVIEAFQMTEERRWNNVDWPEWLHKAWNMPDLTEGALCIDPDDPAKEKLVIGTLEGVHRVAWGDWIIQGVKGEIYACKPDIFEQTYELAEQTCYTMAGVAELQRRGQTAKTVRQKLGLKGQV